MEHIKRACIQGGWLWKECVHNVTLPDITEWWWIKAPDGAYIPRWHKDDENSLQASDLIKVCSCHKSGCKTCKCKKKMKWACLPFCTCERSCDNPAMKL